MSSVPAELTEIILWLCDFYIIQLHFARVSSLSNLTLFQQGWVAISYWFLGVHDLCKRHPMPAKTCHLLGFGFKFCTLCAHPNKRLNKNIKRTRYQINGFLKINPLSPHQFVHYILELYRNNNAYLGKTYKAMKALKIN